MIIKNGCIHDGIGNVFKEKDIIIEDGIIKAIGENLEYHGADIVDASGKEIFPGFIDALNMYGCRGAGFNDGAELTNPISPEMNIIYSFDHEAMNFQELYKYGMTAACIAPFPSNVLAGQSAVFKTYGNNPYKMLVKEKASMIASVSSEVKKAYSSKNKAPMTKMGAISMLIDALKKSETYKRDEKYDAGAEVLSSVVNGDMPLFINCNTKSEMTAVLIALKPFNKLRVVLTGAFEVDKNTNLLNLENISFITGDTTFATSQYASSICYKDFIEIMKTKIVAIGACGDSYASGKESLLWNAITWYKNGLDEEEVLKRITSVPAELLGVNDKIGSIEVGKHADISIWTSNPIKSYSAKLESIFIDGEKISLEKRCLSCW